MHYSVGRYCRPFPCAYQHSTNSRRPVGVGPRFGYDHRWWGEAEGPAVEDRCSYWQLTRKPLPCLAFVAPDFVGLRVRRALAGRQVRRPRFGQVPMPGCDTSLAGVGLTDHWFLPLCLVVALLALACRRPARLEVLAVLAGGDGPREHAPGRCPGRFEPGGRHRFHLLGADPHVVPGGRDAWPGQAADPSAALSIGFLGAGVYEEALFRLALVPCFFGFLRLLQTPTVLASSIAVTTSALLFSLAHHAGSPGEAFTWFAFIFRWLAGVYFAWVFVVRGFGVAVGTHSAYDVLVGWIGWHL